MSLESDGGMIMTGETKNLLKTSPGATLSTDPTWIDRVTRSDLREAGD
jgi:hypothetical protein